MGQAESQPALDQAVKTGVAFHVLRVAERSPAAEAGIDPFFDFICGVNGQPLVRLLLLCRGSRRARRELTLIALTGRGH